MGQAYGQGIRQKAPGHNEDGQAKASAAHLCQSQNADDADDNLVILEMAALLDNGLGVKGIIQECAGAGNHQQNVIPGDVIHPLVGLPCREHQVTQEDDPGHEGGQPQLLQPAGEQGHIQAEDGKNRKNHIHGDPGLSLPDADIGFPVILLHNGVQVHGLLCFFLLE